MFISSSSSLNYFLFLLFFSGQYQALILVPYSFLVFRKLYINSNEQGKALMQS